MFDLLWASRLPALSRRLAFGYLKWLHLRIHLTLIQSPAASGTCPLVNDLTFFRAELHMDILLGTASWELRHQLSRLREPERLVRENGVPNVLET